MHDKELIIDKQVLKIVFSNGNLFLLKINAWGYQDWKWI